MKREEVFSRDGHRCVYCGELAEKLTLDHVIPRCKGGSNVTENLVTACDKCNRERGDTSVTEFLSARPEMAFLVLHAMTSPLPEVKP